MSYVCTSADPFRVERTSTWTRGKVGVTFVLVGGLLLIGAVALQLTQATKEVTLMMHAFGGALLTAGVLLLGMYKGANRVLVSEPLSVHLSRDGEMLHIDSHTFRADQAKRLELHGIHVPQQEDAKSHCILAIVLQTKIVELHLSDRESAADLAKALAAMLGVNTLRLHERPTFRGYILWPTIVIVPAICLFVLFFIAHGIGDRSPLGPVALLGAQLGMHGITYAATRLIAPLMYRDILRTEYGEI